MTDIFDKWAVGAHGDNIWMLLPPQDLMMKEEALVLAAWLVCLADPLGKRFAEILKEVQGS